MNGNVTFQNDDIAVGELKACCAALYESEWAAILLGEARHPGGLALTGRLGHLLALSSETRLLDVACGIGTSAIYLAQQFGCRVVGLEYSSEAAAAATEAARAAGLGHLIQIHQGDAEALPFADGAFDAILCECALCTFSDKDSAAGEFARVLRSGGRLGFSDVTRQGPLPQELDTLMAWIACLAGARPLQDYVTLLEGAGLNVVRSEAHDAALSRMIHEIRGRLVGADLLLKVKDITLPGVDMDRAVAVARKAAAVVDEGRLGYALLVAER